MQRDVLYSTDQPANRLLLSSGISSRIGRKPFPPYLAYILEGVQRELGQRNADSSTKEDPGANINSLIDHVAAMHGYELNPIERDEIIEHLEKDRHTFGILGNLVDDPQVSDIIITDYQKICIQQGRSNYLTDIRFPSQQQYENFVERLLLKAGTTYSTKKPIADGMLGNHARLHAVHPSICQSGPYLTIRLNRYSSVRLNDLIAGGLAPEGVIDYLRTMTFCGKTILIAGEVGTGKTTLARALSASIPAAQSILVIEDTAEIQLEHPHVRYVRTREANSDGAGRITSADCIRAGMRMAMNRIIFGEMRDAEAAEAFIDVCASGHPGMSTIHARSAMDAVGRLELFLGRVQKGASRNILLEQIARAVQIVVHVDFCSLSQRRRIVEVREVGPLADNILRQREIFRYEYNHGSAKWKVVSKVSAYRSMLESSDIGLRLGELPEEIELQARHALKETPCRHEWSS